MIILLEEILVMLVREEIGLGDANSSQGSLGDACGKERRLVRCSLFSRRFWAILKRESRPWATLTLLDESSYNAWGREMRLGRCSSFSKGSWALLKERGRKLGDAHRA